MAAPGAAISAVDEHGVAAASLGGVESGVGAGDEIVGVDDVRFGDGDADADRHLDADRAAPAHLAAQPLGDLDRVLSSGTGQDHQDSLAPDPFYRPPAGQSRPNRVAQS